MSVKWSYTSLVCAGYLLAWSIGTNVVPFAPEAVGAVTPLARWAFVLLALAGGSLLRPAGPTTAARYGVAAFLVATAAVTLTSQTPTYSAIEWVRYASLFALTALIRKRRAGPGEIYRMMRTIVWIVCLGSIVSFAFVEDTLRPLMSGAVSASNRIRSLGIVNHPNNLGVFGSILMLMCVQDGRSDAASLPTNPAIRVIGFFGGLLVVVASGSRTDLLLSALYLSLAFCRSLQRRSPRYAPKVRATALCIFALLSAAVAAPLWKVTHGDDLPQAGAQVDSYRESNEARMTLWRNALATFQAHPLLGAGFASRVQETYDPVDKQYNIAQYAHNSLLNAMQSGGLVGVGVLLGLLLWLSFLLFDTYAWLDFRRGWCLWHRTRVVPAAENEAIFFALIALGTVLSSSIEGALQGNYGINAIFAISVGSLVCLRQDAELDSASIARDAREDPSTATPFAEPPWTS
jgi:O-antigen ligase